MNGITSLQRICHCVLLAAAPLVSAQSSIFTSPPPDPGAVVVSHTEFGVSGDGVADDSPALQAAIDKVERTHHQGIVFLPEGTYRLRSTIYIWTGIRVIGVGKHRPTLLLARNTPGFQYGAGHYMVQFASDKPAPGAPIVDANARTFYSAMRNINLRIEDGNAAAVGIRFHVAQHSFLSDIDFDIGSGHAAIEDIGNQASKLRFKGGDYGIVTGKTSPGWQFLLMDSAFENQRFASIRTQEAGMTLVRDRFEHTPVAVQVAPGNVEQLYIRDSSFANIPTAAIALGETRNFRSQATVENSSFTSVPVFVRDEQSPSVRGPAPIYRVQKFTRGLMILGDGHEAGVDSRQEIDALNAAPVLVSSDIAALPSVSGWADARALGAIADGKQDDTLALQRALDAHPVLYLPTGRYRVTTTLHLHPNSIVIGLNPITTQIFLDDATDAFRGPGSPVPLVDAPLGGATILTGIGLSTGAKNDRATALLWRAGEHSLVDDVKFIGGHGTVDADGTWSVVYDPDHTGDPDATRRWDAQYPSLWVRGGGGVFRNLWTASTFARAGFVVEHTTVPGVVYQLSSEHHVRNEVEFRDVSHWRLYALQLETEKYEGAEAVALTLSNVHDLQFDNLFMYRVSRVLVPAFAAIDVQSGTDISFNNVHSYAGGRFAFDRTIRDQDTGILVAAHNFTSFFVGDRPAAPSAAQLPEVFSGPPVRLAQGFSNASGLTSDGSGDVFFTDTRMQHVFHWSVQRQRLELKDNASIAPVALVADSGKLFAVSTNKAIYALSGPDPEALLPGKTSATNFVLPTGTHPGIGEVQALLGGETYSFKDRQHISVPTNGSWIALLQASQLQSVRVGVPTLITSENDGVTWTAAVDAAAKLTAKPFIFRGGTAVLQSASGDIFVAESQLFMYDRSGKLTGALELPEQPTGLSFGGADARTLFITTRHSLYAAPLRVAAIARPFEVTYAEHNGQPLQADLYRPSDPGKHPGVIYLHGGGWWEGDRKQLHRVASDLAGQGYFGMSIDYRLAPSVHFPTPLEDVRDAVRWLRTHAEQYDVDPNRIILIGSSAGGHLALMHVLDTPTQGTAVQAVVAINAVIDLTDEDDQAPMVTRFLGLPCSEALSLCREASPLLRVPAAPHTVPPILILHGTADRIVPYRQAEKLLPALAARHIDATLFTIQGAGHSLWAREDLYPAVLEQILHFLNKSDQVK